MECFFTKLVVECKNNIEAICQILRARGFLLEYSDDGIFLSDNSDEEDWRYLKEGLNRYKLGDVIPVHEDGYVAKVQINVEADMEDAIEAFFGRERVSFPVCMKQRTWKHFIRRKYGNKVPVRDLEPFVAYYVKTLSACGVITNFSCDGNHPGKNKVIIGADYPYSIWMNCIIDILLPKELTYEAAYAGNGEFLLDEARKYEIYYVLYLQADWIYGNRASIRSLKDRICTRIRQMGMRKMSDVELEARFVKYVLEEKENGWF